MQFSADLVTFTEKILNGKLHFMRSDHSNLNLITLSSAYKRKENAKVKTKNYICSKLVV